VAPLVETLNDTDGVSGAGWLTLDQEGGEAMGFSGFLQIEKEVVSYDAKEYQFKLDGASSYQKTAIRSMEEYNYYRDKIANNSRMFFTGRVRIPKGGRARFASVASEHKVEKPANNAWPYAATYASYKWCPNIGDAQKGQWKNNEGDLRWDYKGGTVYTVRGTSADPSGPTRNGSESLIRMTNAKESEFYNYGGTVNNIVKSSALAGHGYFTHAPIINANGDRIIPRRVGAGVRILGKTGSYALGVIGAGGIGMYMRYTSAKKMNGWVLEIRPTIEKSAGNVTLYEIINSEWHVRKSVDVTIFSWPADVNTSLDFTNQTWTNLDLAYYPKYGVGDAFVGYINDRRVLVYEPTATVNTSAMYGPFVRGDSYMDVDYTWWCDRADPNNVEGYSPANDIDEGLIDLNDATEGAGGPTAWWDKNGGSLFKRDAVEDSTFGIQEFGPLAHSVIIRDASFGEQPFLSPEIVYAASGEYNIPEYEITPFDAKLVIVNARRRAVNVSGTTAPLSIRGYKIEKNEEQYTLEDHVRSNEEGATTLESRARASRAVHGYSPLEISTDLIQTADGAKSLLNWIIDYCSLDCEIVNCEVFGNPLIEVGDKIRILYDDLGYTQSQMFIVTAVVQNWSNGLTTKLTLRRIK
jgi:hypothetical protein